MKDLWRVYRKNGNELKYLGESTVYIQFYSHHQLIKMLEKAGWKTLEMFDNIETMEKAKIDSPINIVAKKIN
ncbi:MAG: hypothetical protein QXV10_04060 [Nitrososphaerota archaeon]